MNTLTFLNSPLLWGLALGSIPIIIHLLFRRRYRRIEWAPMKYLKLTIQRNRRRIQLEQLLLLLLRVAMILLLFFFLARPVMHAEGLGGWLGGRSRTSQILLIDDSLSMGLAKDGKPALDRAKELASQLIEQSSAKDRFTLVLASRPRQPLLREVELTDLADAQRLVKDVSTSESFVSWRAALESVDELVQAGTFPIREVTILTDLARAGWDKELTELAGRWADSRVRLRIFDVGAEPAKNLSLLSLEQVDRLALVGAPVRWEAVVKNHGADALRDVEATFVVDGQPNVVRIAEIQPGREARLPLSARFQEAGRHDVALRLPADDLPGDNQRWAVVQVRQSLHIVLVDGEPSSEPLGGEVDFVGLALSLGIGAADAFQVDVLADNDWAALEKAQPDLLVLANVATLNLDAAQRLDRLVRGGMGLMIFVGDQIDHESYNRFLYKDGKGLLPAALETIADEDVSGLVLEQHATATPLSALAQLSPAVLERVRIRRYFQVKLPDQTDGLRTLARWNNPSSSPAVLEKLAGQGRVLLWTVTADKGWSDWPTDPSYVLAVRESSLQVARAAGGGRSLTAGEPLRRPVPADHGVSKHTVSLPRGGDPKPLVIEDQPAAEGEKSPPSKALVYGDTRRAGLYTLTWTDSKTGAESDRFAVNPDARESEPGRITPEQLRSLWGTYELDIISAAAGADTVLATRGQEVWRSLAMALLGLVVVEACFATWAGRQR